MPWQQYAADVALEIDPATGELWYEEVVITVPRQSGKTTLILALMIWRCVMMARRLDDRQVVTYLAQSGKMARRKLEREFVPIIRKASRWFLEVTHTRARPVKPHEWKPSMNNGSEHILWGTGSYLQIEAPTDTGSHGDVLDMPVQDEAFARADDSVEQATDAATVTRRSPQSVIVSTAGNEKSIYLAGKVLAGRRACKTGKHGRTCYMEWSVPEDEPRWQDPKVWAQYLPALGHTIRVSTLKGRLTKALRNPDVVDEDGFEPGLAGFKRGYLNIWPKWPKVRDEAPKSEIVPAKWKALTMKGSEIVGGVVIGVGVGLDGVSAAFVICGRTADGTPQVEVIEHELGVWWLERRLLDRCEHLQYPILAVAWDNGGPARPVAPEIQRGAVGVPTMPLNGREWSAACEAFATAVREERIRHLGDLLLQNAVAGGLRQQTGGGWKWDQHAATADITPLIAATAALRALETFKAEEPEEVQPPMFAFT